MCLKHSARSCTAVRISVPSTVRGGRKHWWVLQDLADPVSKKISTLHVTKPSNFILHHHKNPSITSAIETRRQLYLRPLYLYRCLSAPVSPQGHVLDGYVAFFTFLPHSLHNSLSTCYYDDHNPCKGESIHLVPRDCL